MHQEFIAFVKNTFKMEGFIPLHPPVFFGNEKQYLIECIDSTFVSSVGKFVDRFENEVAQFTGSKYAIATVNGTSALHTALLLAGVTKDDEVITQPLTFIATANAISYIGAQPIFIDVDRDTMGLSPEKVSHFLEHQTKMVDNKCVNKRTGKVIKAVVPMHTFGFPCRIKELVSICDDHNIKVVEDAAESLGSYVHGKHTGTFGLLGILSFNGNKTITTGGGGMILTDDETLAKKAKHITTTAKKPHRWEYEHDMIGYNYRLPNINAALGCAQLEKLPEILESKRKLALGYHNFFETSTIAFISESDKTRVNYWLNAVILESIEERNAFLEFTNTNDVMTRPIWKLMNSMSMFQNAQTEDLGNAEWLEDRVVNIPSGVIF